MSLVGVRMGKYEDMPEKVGAVVGRGIFAIGGAILMSFVVGGITLLITGNAIVGGVASAISCYRACCGLEQSKA